MPADLRVGIVDMNAGHANQAIRCLGVILDHFEARVVAKNPGLKMSRAHVSPRDKDEATPRDCHLLLCSGGPGSPFDGDGEDWVDDFGDLLDHVVDENTRTMVGGIGHGPGLFAVCYSYEMAVRHFDVADLRPRATRKFGVMPIYTTDEGRQHPLLADFGDRLFAFEHRNWEAVGLDESALARHGGTLLARESRDGFSKGEALMAFDFAPGVEGVQFHPEADRPGVMAWVARPDQAAAFKEAYGITTYERMVKTVDDPMRLARTFALMIPGFLTRRFNLLAKKQGWVPLDPPIHDRAAFDTRAA
ncbi:MAG: hypothetical protein JNL79_01675 [Myxococcales bacterium]|nr:hypothetical protein [Myxococcales bacterium]